MADVSPRDLRRLATLEERLDKTQEERRTLAAERRELRAALAAESRRTRDAEKRAAAAGDQLQAVLADNNELSKRLEEARADLERLETVALELRTQVDAGRAELERVGGELERLRAELRAVQTERDSLEERIKIADEQLAGKELAPVLPAQDVAKLVDRLVADLGSSLPGVVVREGEVRLKVAFGKVGRATGFVVPSAESPPELRENLHEVALRFERVPQLRGE